ncbi:hypothetical protein E2C01_040440 [Portunus trituberculatus]|uniref:Uncharacterized protein n=1 Tax=Portunus trituberculatus TaxID=210409 RepID=A0A5B7FQS1_PORTR|nr:hypothetical protein [Portunus trituberculatus]
MDDHLRKSYHMQTAHEVVVMLQQRMEATRRRVVNNRRLARQTMTCRYQLRAGDAQYALSQASSGASSRSAACGLSLWRKDACGASRDHPRRRTMREENNTAGAPRNYTGRMRVTRTESRAGQWAKISATNSFLKLAGTGSPEDQTVLTQVQENRRAG